MNAAYRSPLTRKLIGLGNTATSTCFAFLKEGVSTPILDVSTPIVRVLHYVYVGSL